MELGLIIKKYRSENRLSLREFSDVCGLSHSYISSLEKGIDPRNNKPVIPTIETLTKVAAAMNIDLNELISEVGYAKDVLTTGSYSSGKSTTINKILYFNESSSNYNEQSNDNRTIEQKKRDERDLKKFLENNMDSFATYGNVPLSDVAKEAINNTLANLFLIARQENRDARAKNKEKREQQNKE